MLLTRHIINMNNSLDTLKKQLAFAEAGENAGFSLSAVQKAWMEKTRNEIAFIQDCMNFRTGKSSVNSFVSNATCYGVEYKRALILLKDNNLTYP